jgi:hypothetical protein
MHDYHRMIVEKNQTMLSIGEAPGIVQWWSKCDRTKKHDECKINNSSCRSMKPNHTKKTKIIGDEAIVPTRWRETNK